MMGFPPTWQEILLCLTLRPWVDKTLGPIMTNTRKHEDSCEYSCFGFIFKLNASHCHCVRVGSLQILLYVARVTAAHTLLRVRIASCHPATHSVQSETSTASDGNNGIDLNSNSFKYWQLPASWYDGPGQAELRPSYHDSQAEYVKFMHPLMSPC